MPGDAVKHALKTSAGRALAAALCGLVLASPGPARSQELPRHKPRVTDPAEDAPVPGSPSPAKPAAPATNASNAPKARKSAAPAVSPEAAPPAAPPAPSVQSRASSPIEGEGHPFRGASDDASKDEIPPGFHEIPVPREPAPSNEPPRGELEENERLSGINEPGLGLGVEALIGVLVLNGGISSSAQFGWGLAADWHVGRLFRPESYFYQNAFVELSWLHSESTYGTDEVKVSQAQNHFSASALLGTTLGRTFFYGKLGPSLYLMPVTYTVQGTATDFMDAKLGLNLGLGVRFALYLGDSLGVAVRLEATGYRRGYLTDFFFTSGVGLVF